MARRAALVGSVTAVTLFAAAAGLSLYVYAAARISVEELLARRLEATGGTAARMIGALGSGPALDQALADVARAAELDGAYVFDARFTIVADARGRRGRGVNLLRLDPDRAQAALAGRPSVGWGFDVEGLRFFAGYFPVAPAAESARSAKSARSEDATARVLAVEAGEAFTAPSRRLRAAAIAAFTFEGLLGALALLAVVRAVRAAARAQAAYGRAERAGLASRLAAMVAHDVRNPLHIIRACAELLRERLGAARPPLAANDRELLDDILGEVQRLNRMTDDFLDLARDLPLRRAPVDVAALVGEACDKLRLRFPGIDVAATAPQAGAAFADEARLRQVIDNLLENAAQATAGRGAVRVEAMRAEGGVRIAVADEGPGVPPEIAPRLFEPFATGKATGTGLGLALARRIVEQHGGRIDLRPSARGARFELFIPSVSSAPAAPAAAPPA